MVPSASKKPEPRSRGLVVPQSCHVNRVHAKRGSAQNKRSCPRVRCEKTALQSCQNSLENLRIPHAVFRAMGVWFCHRELGRKCKRELVCTYITTTCRPVQAWLLVCLWVSTLRLSRVLISIDCLNHESLTANAAERLDQYTAKPDGMTSLELKTYMERMSNFGKRSLAAACYCIG